jgi:2-hydroxychromene-2-carboxylate isomerase
MASKEKSGGKFPESRISVRFWQPERLFGGDRHSGNRTAYRREVRICPGATRGDIQGDQQHVAVRFAARHQEQAYQALETQRFIRRHNVAKFTHNPFFPVNTLMLMRGAVAARFENMFDPYFHAAYHHMWVEPKKMDDLAIFRNAFMASGIDRLIARAQQDDVKKKLIEDTTDAVNRGAFGSPTFFVGREMFFGKDQLRDVEEIMEQTGTLRSRIA